MNQGLIISFDLDGVIIQNPFDRGIFPWIREHVRTNTPALALLEHAAAEKQMTDAVNGIWFARQKQGDLAGSYDWDDILNQASRSLGGPDIPDVAGLVDRFCAEDGMISVLPGAVEGLELLTGHKATIHALTNGHLKYQWPVLVALGIEHYFDRIITPDVTGFAKPQKAAFDAIPGLQVHVGDMVVHDVMGANQAGVRSVWMNPVLPAELRALSPADRAGSPLLHDVLLAELQSSIYARVHSEATAETASPDLVVLDVLEAAHALLEV